MGGRGSWSQTARGEKLVGKGMPGSASIPSQKIPASQFQTLQNGNKVSKSATFARVEKEISKHTYETGLIVDSQGFVIAAYKGSRSSVNFGNESGKIKGNIITHNHPSGAAAFSVADISSTGKMGGIGIRAATKNNGTAVLKKASNNPEWGKMAKAYDSFLANGKTMKQAQKWLASNAGKYGLSFKIER